MVKRRLKEPKYRKTKVERFRLSSTYQVTISLCWVEFLLLFQTIGSFCSFFILATATTIATTVPLILYNSAACLRWARWSLSISIYQPFYFFFACFCSLPLFFFLFLSCRVSLSSPKNSASSIVCSGWCQSTVLSVQTFFLHRLCCRQYWRNNNNNNN